MVVGFTIHARRLVSCPSWAADYQARRRAFGLLEMIARPTEYKGIRFRSKSEAMFARYLDLILDQESRDFHFDYPHFIRPFSAAFSYEPETHIEGWKPDFFVHLPGVSLKTRNSAHCLGSMDLWVVEYKPSPPTSTYVEQFLAKGQCFRDEIDRIKEHGSDCVTEYIYYGSFYKNGRMGKYVRDFDGDVWHDEDDRWADEYIDEIRNYRYDLIDQG